MRISRTASSTRPLSPWSSYAPVPSMSEAGRAGVSPISVSISSTMRWTWLGRSGGLDTGLDSLQAAMVRRGDLHCGRGPPSSRTAAFRAHRVAARPGGLVRGGRDPQADADELDLVDGGPSRLAR